jgi:hypothetical protein
MVLILPEDRKANVHIGRDWPQEQHEQIQRIFYGTAARGLTQGQPSLGIRRCVEELDKFVRRNLTPQ